jgi:L-gulonolactone oxidase
VIDVAELRPELWSNWAGNQRCRVPVAKPSTEGELCRLVARAALDGARVKAVGTGHSFSDVALTDGVLVDLSDYDRILEVDREACTVTVQAGARLRDVSELLWTRGLAFENLGDIDVQTVAGATATATHGTGLTFRNLSSAVVAMRIVDGSGGVVECSAAREPEVFAAARVGLGALGIVSTLTLRVVPAFHLHAVEEPRRIDEVLESFRELVATHDHYEFFWVPHTGWALTKANRRNHEAPAPRPAAEAWRRDVWWDNVAFDLVNRVGALRPSLLRPLLKRIPGAGHVEYNDRSYRVFASPRTSRFVEMEYAVPLEATVEAVQGVRSVVEGLGWTVSFPVEVRAVRGDDIPLSTASGRDSGYVAVHMHRSMPHEEYFGQVESIMRDLGGRPHWGKLHRRTAADLAPAYPGWDRFQEVRARMDPTGTFASAATDRVLGPVGG